MIAIYLAPVYLMANLYLLFHILGWLDACHIFPNTRLIRKGVGLCYLFLSASPLLAFGTPSNPAFRGIKQLGSDWLGVMLYLLLAFLAADLFWIFRLFLRKIHKKHAPEQQHCKHTHSRWQSDRLHALSGGVCIAAALLTSIGGFCQAKMIHITPYEITIGKEEDAADSCTIVLIADLHLGYHIGKAHMRQMAEKINALHADLVVIAGDIFDNAYEALDDPEALCAIFRSIRTKYGVYACYGNHDVEEKILAGFTFPSRRKKQSSRKMDAFLEKAGIHLLKDEAALIDDRFYLYGRPDAQKPGRGITKRKTPAELMQTMDGKKPVFVIDHEPKEFQELADAGVDADFCGHTHDGQMFPANLLTALLWENAYGYFKKGDMHTIVTSGVGLFGPNMRVGTKAEICFIQIHF